MRIFLAADHAGYDLKEELEAYLAELGHEVTDCGTEEPESTDDYPDFISKVGRNVSRDPESTRGVVLGGSGQGEAIVANKFEGVRAAVYYGGQEQVVQLSREHNDANVLSLGARFLTIEEAKDAVRMWLEVPFSQKPRHVRRIEKIQEIERKQ